MMRTIFPRAATLLSFALLVPVLTGCGGSAVTGKVTLDGRPVDGGSIIFISSGTLEKTQIGGEIVRGTYTLTGGRIPGPGTQRVEISWLKKTGNKVPMGDDPGNFRNETVQVIPLRYNTQSELTADLKGTGKNTFNFALTSP
jgi:hypothetical protein